MSPSPLDPMRAMREAIASLDEQVKTRVTSVENGRKFQNSGARRGRHAGRRRDLRDHRRVGGFRDAVARSAPADRDRRGARFPDRVARRPERYAMPAGKSVADVKAELEACSRRSSRRASSPIRAATARRGRSRSRTCSTARPTSRWPTTSTTASSCGGARPKERRGLDLQAPCAAGAAREDDAIPRLVPRAAPSGARDRVTGDVAAVRLRGPFLQSPGFDRATGMRWKMGAKT